MTRWWTLALLGALTVAPATAQAINPEEAAAADAQAAADEAATLYEDVLLLIPIRTLALTDEQLTRLAELNGQVLAAQADLAALRDTLWQEHQGDFESVINAWLSGGRVDARAQRAADNAVARLSTGQQQYATTQADAAQRFVAALSEEQSAIVETRDAAAARQALAQRIGGFDTVGAYVASQMDPLRDLMPEEFTAMAPDEALRIASVIAGPDTAQVEPLAARLLSLMQEIRTWTPPRYQEQRASLPAQINVALGFGSGETPPVTWEEIVRLASSTRTPDVITLVRTPAAPAEGETQ